MIAPADQIAPLVSGCAQVLSEKELANKLALGRPLKVKLGVDPTSPDIHLGHTVGLSKLRQFQELGHEAILIIGDFTAMIGDPSGRSVTRPHLSHEQVMEHAKSYQDQAFKILDPERTEVAFNSTWMGQQSAADLIKLAMLRIDEELRRRRLRTKMLLQVHDELVFDLFESEATEVLPMVEEKMKTALPLAAPIEVELGTGQNWLAAH
jgi:tyrosyl-tRNA synthetase